MKKIVTFIMGLVAFATLNAANTANVTLTLTANGGTEASQVKLRLDPSVTAPTYASWFQNLEAVGTVNIYAKVGTEEYSQYKYNTLTNVPLEVVTNRREASLQHYTITFSVLVNTETLYLTDLVLDPNNENPIAIVDGETYEFDVNTTLHPNYVAGTNYVIADRFIINYVAPAPVYDAQVTTNEYGWASFSYSEDLAPVEASAQTLYKGAISGDVLALDEVDYVKTGEGVLVKGAANTTYYFAVGNGSADFAGNDLRPTSAYSYPMENVFVLKGEAFLEYIGTTALKANKAFIQLLQSGAGAPKRIRMVVNHATGVENAAVEVKAEKFVENGQVLIRRGNEVYNLQGQIVK